MTLLGYSLLISCYVSTQQQDVDLYVLCSLALESFRYETKIKDKVQLNHQPYLLLGQSFHYCKREESLMPKLPR